MRSILLGIAAVTAVACGGDDGGSNGALDAGNLPPCTGVAYDSCTDTTGNTDCDSGLTCRLFMGDGFTICMPTCDASNPCPADEDGNPVTCNMMGRCKPSAPNACTP